MAQKGRRPGAYNPTQPAQQEDTKLSVTLPHSYQMATLKINKTTGIGKDAEKEFLCTIDR